MLLIYKARSEVSKDGPGFLGNLHRTLHVPRILRGEDKKGKEPLSQSSRQLNCRAQTSKVCAAAGEQRRDRVVGGEIREDTRDPAGSERHCTDFSFRSVCDGKFWRVLSRGVPWSDLCLKMISQAAICKRDCSWAREEAGTPGRTPLR